MRRFLISLLLASAAAATPALAQSDDFRPHFGGARDARADSRDDRQQGRVMRVEHSQAPQQVPVNRAAQAPEQVQVNRPAQTPQRAQLDRPGQAIETHAPSSDRGMQIRSFGGAAGQGFGSMGIERSPNMDSANRARGWRDRQVKAVSPETMRSSHIEEGAVSQVSSHRATDWRMHERQVRGGTASRGQEDASNVSAGPETTTVGGRAIQWRRVPTASPGGLVQPDRPLPRVMRTRTPVVSDMPREGTQPPMRSNVARPTTVAHWDTGWRHDNRFNWWDWRRRHHSFFHLGFYYDPFGWSYQRFLIGWRLWPAYFGSQFWITDPWYYRVPPAPLGYRWIRYYDDLLLVDTWDGTVVDVIYNFFW